ncbi:hypothetical protein KCP71_01430 [Salmonella enterica subsp. enterica]|nr:hypothetical protein KCP71_01430 [Salmonella enterica subsp. enterica]
MSFGRGSAFGCSRQTRRTHDREDYAAAMAETTVSIARAARCCCRIRVGAKLVAAKLAIACRLRFPTMPAKSPCRMESGG